MAGREFLSGVPIDPLMQREILRTEGWDPLEAFGKEKIQPGFVVYLCAPLQPTKTKSAMQHITEVAYKAAQIEGALYEGRVVFTAIPHIKILEAFNEFQIPGSREMAIAANSAILTYTCHALVRIGRRTSEGMRQEIYLARQKGLPVMTLTQFKNRLTDLPSKDDVSRKFGTIMKSLPGEFFSTELMQIKPPK